MYRHQSDRYDKLKRNWRRPKVILKIFKTGLEAIIKHHWHPVMVAVCSPYGRTNSHSDPDYS